MIGRDDTWSKHPVDEFGQEDEGHDGGDAGVGDEDVGGVSHDSQGRASLALGHQTVETLGDILRAHQASELLQVRRGNIDELCSVQFSSAELQI